MSCLDAGSNEEPPESSFIVHERQSLQLCAVHTVNNLLQLSDENNNQWTCGGHDIQRDQNTWACATKAELDAIADELTVAENQLLVVDPCSNESETTTTTTASTEQQQLSFFEKLSSQHRTLVFGNYSTEVIQTALKRRGVELSWFTPTPNNNNNADLLLHVDDPNSIVIGFIVNEVREDALFGRILRVFWDSGRHWYAVTRIQRGAAAAANNNPQWKVLDGMLDQVEFLSTEMDVLEYLQAIVQDGGTVLRATITMEILREKVL